MTTHKAHTNILHNQCLALQVIAFMLESPNVQRNSRSVWVYLHAARLLVPGMFDPDVVEPPIPPLQLPKVMVDYAETYDAMAHDDETLRGIGR